MAPNERLQGHKRAGTVAGEVRRRSKDHQGLVGWLHLEIGVQGVLSNQWNQNTDNSSNTNPFNQNNGTLIRKSNWFVKASISAKSLSV